MHARLLVAHINDPLLTAAARAALHDASAATRTANDLRTFADETLGAAELGGISVGYCVATGEPAQEIIKAAGRRRADLIVMGTHGVHGIDRILLGSTTARVLTRTKVPVLAVPVARRNRRRAA
jgi:nucleotide-binding universal stress UspA family protein